jgi:hypothetical protein
MVLDDGNIIGTNLDYLKMLREDELLEIIKLFNDGQERLVITVYNRKEIYDSLVEGKYRNIDIEILNRVRRYETLNILPKEYLMVLTFNLSSENLLMTKYVENLYRLLVIYNEEDRVEYLMANKRDWDTNSIKKELGMIPPNDYISIDYMGKNIKYYPKMKALEKLDMKKILKRRKEERREILNKYNDQEIFGEMRIVPAYSSRLDLIENIVNYLNEDKDIFYVEIPINKMGINYGNVNRKEIIKMKELKERIRGIEDVKEIRDLQNIIINYEMMDNQINDILSKKIIELEGINMKNGYDELFKFNRKNRYEIGMIRRGLRQLYYYSRTRNDLYRPIVGIEYISELSTNKQHNLKQMLIKDELDDLMKFSINYFNLFYGINYEKI